MNTWQIHIEGQVQGVGFRPFVFLLAKEYGLNGWVNNTVDGVNIEFNAEKKLALEFKEILVARAPRLSRITSISLSKVKQKGFYNFQVINSEKIGTANLLLTPDLASRSADLQSALREANNRRNKYPFITCTNCGPRFSIIHRLPYDRVNTKMGIDIFQKDIP